MSRAIGDPLTGVLMVTLAVRNDVGCQGSTQREGCTIQSYNVDQQNVDVPLAVTLAVSR